MDAGDPPVQPSFSGSPSSRQQVYVLAQQKIQAAVHQSALLTEAQENTEDMLDGMLTSLGFQDVTVTSGESRSAAGARLR